MCILFVGVSNDHNSDDENDESKIDSAIFIWIGIGGGIAFVGEKSMDLKKMHLCVCANRYPAYRHWHCQLFLLFQQTRFESTAKIKDFCDSLLAAVWLCFLNIVSCF